MSYPPWNSDCLNVIAVLAMSLDAKKLKKLARRQGLCRNGSSPDLIEAFQGCHEACHRDAEFARALEKELDSRFRTTVAGVRSMEIEQVRELNMPWPMPLLWATLTDNREDVQRHGRYLLHGLLWNVLHRASFSNENETNLREAVDALEQRVKDQSAELANMRELLQRRELEAGRLRRLTRDSLEIKKGGECAATGTGRLSRQVRRLQYELGREQERTRALAEIIRKAGFLPSEETGADAPGIATTSGPPKCPCEGPHDSSPCRDTCRQGTDFCPKCPLEGLRVAVIGGPDRMQPAYRKVVQQLGAEFLFHDGEVKNGSYRLKGMVCGADIVVFITSVNSHGALNAVKAVCRKNGKKFIALRETGAESLGKTLKVVAA